MTSKGHLVGRFMRRTTFLSSPARLTTSSTRLLSTVAEPASQEPQRKKKSDMKPQESHSFVMNLFRGHLHLNEVFPYPEVLDEEASSTLRLLTDASEKFFQEVNDASKNDKMAEIDEKVMSGLKEMGALGLQVPVEFGGVGLNNTQYARLGQVLGAHDLGVAICTGAHQSIGFKGILLFGTEEQKQKYLPDLASGKKIAAFALTEPSSGSDANSIRSRAELSKDEKHYILNGTKIWISNGGIADVFTVFVQTPVTKEDGVEKDKVSAFIVERKFGGVTSGPPEDKMGIKCSNTAEVHFDNVKIPRENIIGKEGEGFKVAMNILNTGRFGMAAAMTGTIGFCLQKAIDHVTTREQFGRKLEAFSGIQEKIARMVMAHYVCESIAYMLSGLMDKGSKDYQLEAAIGKVMGSEAAWHACDEAIQILGGMGFMRVAELERVLRDLRIFRIFEGTNDILRLFIVLTGCQFAGGHLRQAMKSPSFLLESVGKRVSMGTGLSRLSSGGSLKEKVHPDLAESAKSVALAGELFGITIQDMLRKYGKGIIEEQCVLNRVAEATMDMYAMVVTLSRASRALHNSAPSAQHERLITQIFCRQASERVRMNLGIVKSAEHKKDFDLMGDLAKEVLEHKGILHQHPLGF